MKEYIKAKMEITVFEEEDIITTSIIPDDDDFGIELPDIELDW